ncbi:outer membrane beta-barrel protein [Bdellovibrio sp. HCB2-146]|uniref:outer membrane beta-barrel protein n=1 Tax=Bdellovibrio sp. HCB2-146 TaxID=3394362 RepID=UPI0039BC9F9F
MGEAVKTTSLISHLFLALVLVGCGLLLSHPAHAQSQSDQKHYLLAQSDPDEAYDPFTDYSEFDEESDEEADINFFRNGRFFTIGLSGGYRGFTGNMANIYDPAPNFGIFLSYFFDLRLALSLGFQTGDHSVKFTTQNKTNTYTGNVSLSSLNFDLKYYLNTQNVTRGLADLNPYILGGIAQFYRTYTINTLDDYARDAAMGFDIGAGLEIPLMRKKAYLGIQAAYHYVNFGDENKSFVTTGERLDETITGDFYDLLFIIGMNF